MVKRSYSMAPGKPGVSPTWTSSDKDLIGCALGASHLWFSIGHGIVNEVYYPRIDMPQIRDLGFIIADGKGFWVEVKRLNTRKLRLPDPGIPAIEIIHTHPRFQLRLHICPDPKRDVLLIKLQLQGAPELRPYVLLAPHLGGTGYANQAWALPMRGRMVLSAARGPFGLALLADDPHSRDAFSAVSTGYVGVSDGWQDFAHNGSMQWSYDMAGPGNVALMGALTRDCVLALGLSSSTEAAATLARCALAQDFTTVWETHCLAWRNWHNNCHTQLACVPKLSAELEIQYRTSAMVLRSHMDKIFPGAMVASLSIPWGNCGDERGGYHLVWPRDLVECAGALIVLGALDDARDVLRYLIASQHEDGHWYQNQWLDSTAYWHGVQLDEAAFPVLLAASLAEHDALDGIDVRDMVARALSYIALNGPASAQDRWEEDAGVNTFTLATCIAALVAGAHLLSKSEQPLLLDLADYWNAHIEQWTVARNTPLSKRCAVNGYYVRISPQASLTDNKALTYLYPIKNHADNLQMPASEQVGVDFLQLVRLGLRKANHPLIQDTLKVADALLKVSTTNGPTWHRYNGDGYGEHQDGSPFDGSGIGRAWPLLTGERGHFELAAGNDPLPYIISMTKMASELGMLPEQLWDSDTIKTRGLFAGRPSGSAMPLAWAHAEYIKLVSAWRTGHISDRLQSVWERYHAVPPQAYCAYWSLQAPISTIEKGHYLVLLLPAGAIVHIGINGWQHVQDISTQTSALGLHWLKLDYRRYKNLKSIDFTWRWLNGDWHGCDYSLSITQPISRNQPASKLQQHSNKQTRQTYPHHA